LFPVVNFFKRVVTKVALFCFQLLLLKHWHFTG